MTDGEVEALAAVVQVESRLTGAGSPYELTVTNVDDIQYRTYRNAPRSLNDVFRKASGMGDAGLAVFADRRLSYAEAFAEAGRSAGILRERFGVANGTRVGIALENRPEWLTAFIAVTSIGATAVLVDARNVSSISQSLRTAGCSLAVVEDSWVRDRLRDIDNSNRWIVVGKDEDGWTRDLSHISIWSDLVRDERNIETGSTQKQSDANAHWMQLPSLPEDGEAIIAYTSGTTGVPKGVVLTHRSIITGLMNMMLAGVLANAGTPKNGRKSVSPKERARRTPCALVLMPLSYIGGYSQLLLMLTIGGKLVFKQKWDAEEVGRLVDREQVGSLVGATASQVRELMRSKADAGPLASIGIHGVALHRTLIDEVEVRWPQVTVGSGYGMTETNGSIAGIAGETLRAFPHLVGRVLPTIELRIVGPDGQEVPEGEIGEVWLRGASLLRGYCTGPGDAERLANGWYKTGDLGYLAHHRFLSIVDRIDHVIQYGEKRISATELERAIVAKEGVAEAAVLFDWENGQTTAVNPRDGLSIMVVVAPKVGAALDTHGIGRAVVDYGPIPENAVKVVEIPTLPKNRSGKVDRSMLRAEFGRQPEAAIRAAAEALP